MSLQKKSGNANAAKGNGNTANAAGTPSETSIKIPVGNITNHAKWFEYESIGVKIRFFAVKASDGSIKTAFDACDVCYKAKKGYRQEGSDMVCNNCGRRFAIDRLGTENKAPGGCWPGYLPNAVAGGNLVIQKSDLEKGKYRFE